MKTTLLGTLLFLFLAPMINAYSAEECSNLKKAILQGVNLSGDWDHPKANWKKGNNFYSSSDYSQRLENIKWGYSPESARRTEQMNQQVKQSQGMGDIVALPNEPYPNINAVQSALTEKYQKATQKTDAENSKKYLAEKVKLETSLGLTNNRIIEDIKEGKLQFDSSEMISTSPKQSVYLFKQKGEIVAAVSIYGGEERYYTLKDCKIEKTTFIDQISNGQAVSSVTSKFCHQTKELSKLTKGVPIEDLQRAMPFNFAVKETNSDLSLYSFERFKLYCENTNKFQASSKTNLSADSEKATSPGSAEKSN